MDLSLILYAPWDEPLFMFTPGVSLVIDPFAKPILFSPSRCSAGREASLPLTSSDILLLLKSLLLTKGWLGAVACGSLGAAGVAGAEGAGSAGSLPSPPDPGPRPWSSHPVLSGQRDSTAARLDLVPVPLV